jgi:hypothetical protein
MSTVIGSLTGPVLPDDLLPWAGVFMSALTVNNEPQAAAITGLRGVLHACTDIGAFLTHGRCLDVIAGFIKNGDATLLMAIVEFVACVLEDCSDKTRTVLVAAIDWDEWATIGESEDDGLTILWITQTVQMCSNNPVLTATIMCGQTVFQIVKCCVNGSFEVRKVAIHAFMSFCHILKVSILRECAKLGLIASVVDLFDLIDDDEDRLAFLMTLFKTCAPFCLTGEIDDQLQQVEQLALDLEGFSECLQSLDEARELR